MQVWNITRHLYLSYVRSVVKSTLGRTVSGIRCKTRVRSALYWQFLIYIFSVSLNIRACYITSHRGRVHSKECYFYILNKLYCYFFFFFFFFFSSENLCFHYFHFFLSRNIASVSKSCKLNIFFSFFPFLSFN